MLVDEGAHPDRHQHHAAEEEQNIEEVERELETGETAATIVLVALVPRLGVGVVGAGRRAVVGVSGRVALLLHGVGRGLSEAHHVTNKIGDCSFFLGNTHKLASSERSSGVGLVRSCFKKAGQETLSFDSLASTIVIPGSSRLQSLYKIYI